MKTFEIIRRAGQLLRPERTIGAGMKTPINAGACIRVGDGVYFATIEPEDPDRANVYNAALHDIAAGLRQLGYTEERRR